MIGLIVDGVGDYAALAAKYRGRVRVLKTGGPRGHTVSASAIANSARRELAMLKALGCKIIAIVTDFESRQGDVLQFERQVEQTPECTGCGVKVFAICANQMIENWYLADIEELSRSKNYLKKNLKQKSYESKNGKAEIKRLIKPGYDYSEVKHGPELLCSIRDDIAQGNSRSFMKFRAITGL